jgi:hypothetical protein
MDERTERWPALPTSAWRDTRATLHLMTQIVGKIRLALTPWQNHSWHVPLYVTARGLTTSPIPYRGRSFQIDFDFIDHLLWIRTSNGEYRQIMLRPVTIAEFYGDVMIALPELGIAVTIDTMPNEISDAVRFQNDTVHKSYDPNYAHRFWRVLAATNEVLARFRTGFIGKASPVHFFGVRSISRSRAFPDGGRRCIQAACRTCLTKSRARPIRTKFPARVSGRAAASTTRQRSIPTPTRHRKGSRIRAWSRRRRSGRRS